MKKIILAILMVLILSNVVMGASLNPSPENPVTLRLAYTDNATWPETAKAPEPEHAFAIVFKSYVETKTNGAIQVELYPATTLGSSKETTEMVKSGTLDITIETGVMGGFFPELQLINIPYVFKSPEIAHWVFDNSKFFKDLMDRMEQETGLVYLGMGQNGIRHFTNDVRPIHEPKDMEGLKFRVMQSPVFVKTVEALGAKAIPLAHTEIYTSLQTGVVDGQENPVSVIAMVGKFYEVQKYLTLDGHTWSENMMVMNANKFRSLPKEMQQIVKIGGLIGSRADRTSDALISRILGFEVLKENMEIYSPTAAELAKFQEKAQPSVIEWLKGEIGSDIVDEFIMTVKEAEAALGY